MKLSTIAAAMITLAVGGTALAGGPQKPPSGGTTTAPVLQSWMSTEVGDAWASGYKGQGVTITVVDDFSSNSGYYGNLAGTTELLRHGEWTLKESSLIAPSAKLKTQDFTSGRSVSLARGLNVINLSYGMMAPTGYSSVNWSSQEASLIKYATGGAAVISKAAGNDYGTAVGEANKDGQLDYLNRDLIGAQSAIFVGALNKNGTTSSHASIASYSNIAGANTTVQNQFLVVGVEGDKTGLYGTSFAAPVIAGYSAIIGSKFTKATPTQIANQLLNTARQDTISGFSPAVHGRGEASITRALAPVSIQ